MKVKSWSKAGSQRMLLHVRYQILTNVEVDLEQFHRGEVDSSKRLSMLAFWPVDRVFFSLSPISERHFKTRACR